MTKPAHYDNYDYEQYWEGRTYEHLAESFTLQKFFEIIGPVTSILDIGAGFGRLTPKYASYTKKITLLEPSKSLLSIAKKRLSLPENELVLKQGTIDEVKQKIKQKVDVAILIRVMHHLCEPEKSIADVSSVIKPGGYFILEFANKLHGKAQIEHICKGNILYPFDRRPVDKRSKKNKGSKTIAFTNWHPEVIFELLQDNGFEIIEARSVSNIRSETLKQMLPMWLLLGLEMRLQKVLAKLHFGPSIFVLARKSPRSA
ncbi:methyltransferase domain-containing protein [Candidatus Woesebacteria bacterium]|nr:methyltransferase domain-containing protein [Candidatus Woesebacteria bacterium]MBP9687393.1 methyltransferase domain-containing protein [Candidatus Woesebacteria bacterium]